MIVCRDFECQRFGSDFFEQAEAGSKTVSLAVLGLVTCSMDKTRMIKKPMWGA